MARKERVFGKVVLSCHTDGCCPTIDFEIPGKVVITDDFGGKILLTRDQWMNLKKFILEDAA